MTNITQMIKATGKTRREICKEAGVSSAMLSLIESGDRQVGTGKIEALARALNVAPAALRPDLAMLFKASSPSGEGSLACAEEDATKIVARQTVESDAPEAGA